MTLGNYELINYNSFKTLWSSDEFVIGDVNPFINFKILFEEKLEGLSNYYTIENLSSLESFLKENEYVFVLLDEIKPILEDVFPSKNYHLRIVKDPEFEDTILMVIIKLDYSEEPMRDIIDKLNFASSRFRPLKRKETDLNNILIDVESL